MRTSVCIFIILLCFTTNVTAASFNCTKASTTIEKMICADENLLKLDEELNTIYKQALSTESSKEELKKQQLMWIKKVRNTCKDTECLKVRYDERIAALNNSIADASTSQHTNGVRTSENKAELIPRDVSVKKIEWLSFSSTEYSFERELVIKHKYIRRSQLKNGRIYIALKDLNGDGVKEIFAYTDIFDYCGQQDGCSLSIYTINKGKLFSIGPIEDDFPMFIDYGSGKQKLQKLIGILSTKTSGWHNISLRGETIWKWDGKHY